MPSYYHYTFAGLAAFTLTFTGCAAGNGQCAKPVGDYTGSYGIVAGNCTRVVGRTLVFDQNDTVNTVMTMNQSTGPTRTELNRVGCTIEVRQDVTDMGVTSTLQGELEVNGNTLSGMLAYSELMPDGKTERCRGQIDAQYELNDGVPVGAAAQAVLMSP
jgi:hypothetical protein